ncbi:MAG TPA: hypothetical protein VM324_11405 [Egibacteraceae bacterium]|jgi:hypothetical protein|nr:hypothetical protein [Egibacteraceae bacterium]
MPDRGGRGSSGSLLQGGLWMLILAVLLSWLPILGPLIAGFVGGRMIGEQTRALGVALVPAVILAGVLWAILAAFDLPVLGAVAGFGALVVVAVQELPLLLGAWFGAATNAGSRAAA